MTESSSHEIRWRSDPGQLTVGWRGGEGSGKSSGGEVVLDWLQVTTKSQKHGYLISGLDDTGWV